MNKASPIGVIDSGVGGLTVLKWLIEFMPSEDFIFIGDTARAPYGNRSQEEIIEFVSDMMAYLYRRGVKQVVIACNTITALGGKIIQGDYPCSIVGMSKGERLILATTKNKRVGVMATDFTVRSKIHAIALHAIDSDVQVIAQGCPKLVLLVEKQEKETSVISETIHQYIKPLAVAGVDTVILSCTHFPFFRKEIEECLGSGVTVIDPAEETARLAKETLEEKKLLHGGKKGRVEICFTQNMELGKSIARQMISVDECVFREVSLV